MSIRSEFTEAHHQAEPRGASRRCFESRDCPSYENHQLPLNCDVKGRFLGIAQNIGDAFCFLILTQPDDETETSPQVLARSVIRRRYPRDDTSEIVPASPSTTLSFYCNDERTLLADPSSIDDGDPGSEKADDVVGGTVAELRALLSPSSRSDRTQLPDEFEDGILEVYGPPTKRPRHSILAPEAFFSESQSSPVTQQPPSNSEEQMVFPTASGHTPPLDPIVTSQTDSTPVVQSRNPASTPVIPTANVRADPTNDGSFDDHADDPGHGGDVRQITQDEDLDPPVFDDIAHQFERIAADSDPDELFDRIDGHEWQNGLLMFRIRWKTDEISILPFSTVKRDFLSETACYVLEHKLGNDSGRYTGGRYTRWARQFNRNFSKIVRRIMRDAGGSYHGDDTGSPTTIRVASHLPNGTRLIRRIIRAVPTTGGVRKRKKPGRISRPLEVKYGVPIPEERATRSGTRCRSRKHVLGGCYPKRGGISFGSRLFLISCSGLQAQLGVSMDQIDYDFRSQARWPAQSSARCWWPFG
ncbi:hypothetical protein MHU86_25171 [Fragilaria crotonensis]|nr:hypothetical protein MHU86_25171 [Fragilaria crotonensis]